MADAGAEHIFSYGGVTADSAEKFGHNFDPSHLIWQGVDPAEFIRYFPNRIYHVHMKDAKVLF